MPVIFMHSLMGLFATGYVTAFAIWTASEARLALQISVHAEIAVVSNFCLLAVL